MLAPQQPGLLEVAQRVADGDAADAQHLAEPILVGNLVPSGHVAVVDQRAQRLLGLVPERLGPAAVRLRMTV